MSWELVEVRELRQGRYISLDNEPCKIISMTTSKPGKHGEAKARIEAIGLFDESKRSVVYPVKHKVRVPMIDKRQAQVIAIMGDEVQLMDLETYETFQLQIEEEFKGKLQPGKNIQYLFAMGRKRITRT